LKQRMGGGANLLNKNNPGWEMGGGRSNKATFKKIKAASYNRARKRWQPGFPSNLERPEKMGRKPSGRKKTGPIRSESVFNTSKKKAATARPPSFVKKKERRCKQRILPEPAKERGVGSGD